MADIYDASKRRLIMSKISGKDTKPEIFVRSSLFRAGFRFRKNVASLPGRPDVVLPKYKSAVFVHGCFWHGHQGCASSKLPSTNLNFWRKKIGDTVRRDQRDIDQLKDAGWRVFVVWRCELSNEKKRLDRMQRLFAEISAFRKSTRKAKVLVDKHSLEQLGAR